MEECVSSNWSFVFATATVVATMLAAILQNRANNEMSRRAHMHERFKDLIQRRPGADDENLAYYLYLLEEIYDWLRFEEQRLLPWSHQSGYLSGWRKTLEYHVRELKPELITAHFRQNGGHGYRDCYSNEFLQFLRSRGVEIENNRMFAPY